jgi:hypothetical protein
MFIDDCHLFAAAARRVADHLAARIPAWLAWRPGQGAGRA